MSTDTDARLARRPGGARGCRRLPRQPSRWLYHRNHFGRRRRP